MPFNFITQAATAALSGGPGAIQGATGTLPPSSSATGGSANAAPITLGAGPSTGGGLPPWFWPAAGVGVLALAVVLLRR